ncbi:MAG: helix-turn-helix domain-containing protein [Clostridiales Family XIII bacterium]|jgi:transcriptional regulator with XRE-family HTH domain|nr:helix-turn-helix domain-containing protein [Clostridiales Family XIII bacterium]
MINDSILAFNNRLPGDIALDISRRVKARRLEMDLTQKALAGRAGITFSTYRRFERSGEISLRGLILVSVALGMEENFDGLFTKRQYRDIEEVINADTVRERKRGRQND